jgi:hypothetical protein
MPHPALWSRQVFLGFLANAHGTNAWGKGHGKRLVVDAPLLTKTVPKLVLW